MTHTVLMTYFYLALSWLSCNLVHTGICMTSYYLTALKKVLTSPLLFNAVLPDFAQVYSFIGSVFDPDVTGHLQKLKKMDPIDIETVCISEPDSYDPLGSSRSPKSWLV